MAVAIVVTLPSQPSDGSVTFVPLGGDGFSAPTSAYALQNLKVTGDATGGAASLTANLDNRFCSLVSFVSFRITQTTSADADFRLAITSAAGGVQTPQILESGPVTAISATVSTATINKTLQLQPMMLPGAGNSGAIDVDFLNVDTDIYRISALIYNFNIRVRELTPMGPLLWARGAT